MSIESLAKDYAAAWSSGKPEAVLAFYRDDGAIAINRGEPIRGAGGFAGHGLGVL